MRDCLRRGCPVLARPATNIFRPFLGIRPHSLGKLCAGWAKEERFTRLNRGRSQTTLILLLIISLVGIEASRRIQHAEERSANKQTISLEKLDAEFREAKRIARDWSWWEDTYTFVQGKNPTFAAKNIATSSLFDEGAAMAIYDAQSRRLVVRVGLSNQNGPPDQRELVSCMDSIARTRRQLGVAGIRVICPGEDNNLYVGFASDINNGDNIRSTKATLVYLSPLIESSYGGQLKQELSQIKEQLRPMPLAEDIATGTPLVPLQPETFSTEGRLMGFKPASSLAEQRRELGDLMLILTGGGLIALVMRMRWKLAEREQRLILRQKERWAAQRIRRSHRELNEILDFKRTTHDPSGNLIPAAATPSGDLIFRGMLQQERRHPASSGARQPVDGTPTPAPGSEPNGNQSVDIQFIANRFEQILGNARDLAMHDALTGLANRRYCIEHLEREIHRTKEKQTLLALLFIDLDKFKSINDTYGHRIGDQALREVASHLQVLCRQDDFLARYGGDEFILILNSGDTPNLSHESLTLHAQQVAHRILESLDTIQAKSDSPYRISLSIGIAITDPLCFSSEDIIRNADIAMYKAKKSQGEHIHLYTVGNASDPASDNRLFAELQKVCIASNQRSGLDSFRILFQPIVNASGDLLSVEALARWEHPDLGEIPPSLFIPVAEHYRIMRRVGWHLTKASLQAFKQLIQALTVEASMLELAINISPSQLSDPSFSGQLIDAISTQGLSCNNIKLEITETAIFNSTESVTTNLRRCREAGVRISLDDFGTGYSSMSLLLSLKPDELKIDRSFVISVSNDSHAAQIVGMLPKFTDSVSMSLVAEAVETQESFQQLQQMGVTRFQGYLFSKALDIPALVELVGGNRLTIPLPAA